MARKPKHEEEEKLERWLVSYADFVTLLFATFTVLYATSNVNKEKLERTAASIQKAFLSSGGIFPVKGSPVTPFEKEPNQGAEVPVSPKDQGRFEKKDADFLEKVQKSIQAIFEKSTGLSLRKDDVEVFKTEQGFKIRLDESLLFKPKGSRIKRTNIAFLYEMGKRLSRLGLQIQVEGYSGHKEISNPEGAWKLSLDRSYNIMRFLVDGVGFPKQLIGVAGYGDSRPVASEETVEGQAKNRRVEIAVMAGSQSLEKLAW